MLTDVLHRLISEMENCGLVIPPEISQMRTGWQLNASAIKLGTKCASVVGKSDNRLHHLCMLPPRLFEHVVSKSCVVGAAQSACPPVAAVGEDGIPTSAAAQVFREFISVFDLDKDGVCQWRLVCGCCAVFSVSCQ